MGRAWEEINSKHQTDLWSYCSLLQLTEHYTLVLLLGNTNSSSLATSCLGVLTTNTEAVKKTFKLRQKLDLTLGSPNLRVVILLTGLHLPRSVSSCKIMHHAYSRAEKISNQCKNQAEFRCLVLLEYLSSLDILNVSPVSCVVARLIIQTVKNLFFK